MAALEAGVEGALGSHKHCALARADDSHGDEEREGVAACRRAGRHHRGPEDGGTGRERREDRAAPAGAA